MKKILLSVVLSLLSLILSMLVIIGMAGASTSSDFSLTNTPDKFLAGGTQREVIFDIAVPDNSNQADAIIADNANPSSAGNPLSNFTIERYDDLNINGIYNLGEPIYDDSTGDDIGVLDLNIDILIRDGTNSEADGFVSTNFTIERYIDSDLSGNYTFDEVIGFDDDSDLIYTPYADTIVDADGTLTTGTGSPASDDVKSAGDALSLFNGNDLIRWLDRDFSSNYSNGDDLYKDVDNSSSFNAGDTAILDINSDLSLAEIGLLLDGSLDLVYNDEDFSGSYTDGEDIIQEAISGSLTWSASGDSIIAGIGATDGELWDSFLASEVYADSNINGVYDLAEDIYDDDGDELGILDLDTDTLLSGTTTSLDGAVLSSFPILNKYIDNNLDSLYTDGEDIYDDLNNNQIVDTVEDVMDSITILNNGTAFLPFDASLLELWSESVITAGFQSSEDTLLASSITGAFPSLAMIIPSGGKRIYATANINMSAISGRTIQAYLDINGFVTDSLDISNNGPTNSAIYNLGIQVIDTSAPVTSDDYGYDWVQDNITVNLSSIDDYSGVAQTTYCVDAANTCNPIITGNTILVTNEGVNYIRYNSSDNVNNAEIINSKQVKIDKTKPTTVSDVPSGWQNNDVLVTITPSDSLSGVNNTFVCTDQTDDCIPSSGDSVIVSLEGTNYIRHFAIDNVGNIGDVISNTVDLDKIKPNTTDDAPSIWQTSPFNVTLNTSDSLSGIAATTYCVDKIGACSPNINGTLINITEDGEFYIRYFSTDLANNKENTKNASSLARLDTSAVSASNFQLTPTYITTSGKVDVSCSGNAGVSGVKSIKTWIKKHNGDVVEKEGSSNSFSDGNTNYAGVYSTGCKVTNNAGVTIDTQSGLTFQADYDGGSSSSSGGGGSSHITQLGAKWNTLVDFGAVFTIEGRVNDVFNITVQNKEGKIIDHHDITIKAVDGIKITLLIESEPLTLTMNEGDIEYIDFDGDGNSDVRLIAKHVGTKTGLSIVQVKFTETLPRNEPGEESEEEFTPNATLEISIIPKEEKTPKITLKGGILIGLIIVLIIMGLIWWFWKKKDMEG